MSSVPTIAARDVLVPRRRIAALVLATVLTVLHGYAAIIFISGPVRPSALLVNGLLLGTVVVSGASIVAVRSRRLAVVLAVVLLLWIVGVTAILVAWAG